MKQVRTVKIYNKFTPRGGRCSNYYLKLPEIRITGKWLEACGFKIGHQVEIAIRKNKLIITLVPGSEPKKDYITILKEMSSRLAIL